MLREIIIKLNEKEDHDFLKISNEYATEHPVET